MFRVLSTEENRKLHEKRRKSKRRKAKLLQEARRALRPKQDGCNRKRAGAGNEQQDDEQFHVVPLKLRELRVSDHLSTRKAPAVRAVRQFRR